MIKSNTPYMLRSDGTLLECGSIHPYIIGSWSDDYFTNYKRLVNKPEVLEWFLNNTLNEKTKELIKNFNENKFDREDDILDDLAELTNKEFCKVRTSNMRYKYGGNNGEIYFRVPKDTRFNWFDNIWKVVMENKDYIQDVSILKDIGSAYQPAVPSYMKIRGQDLKHIPTDELLTMRGNPVLEAKEDSKEDYEKTIRNILKKYDNETESRFTIMDAEPGSFVHKYDDGDIDFSKFSHNDKNPIITFMICGGLNGPGEWTVYLDKLSKLFKDLQDETGLSIQIQDISNDILDDVWTAEVLMYDKLDENLKNSLNIFLERLTKLKESKNKRYKYFAVSDNSSDYYYTIKDMKDDLVNFGDDEVRCYSLKRTKNIEDLGQDDLLFIYKGGQILK